MDGALVTFLTALGNLGAPALVVVGGAVFTWAIATQRLVPGRQYQAERARGDKYEEAHRKSTEALIQDTAARETTIAIVTSFQNKLDELSNRGGKS